MQPNWQNQILWTGDNLDIMRGMNSESVDLIYLDPPFNSNRNYAAPIGSEAAGAAFKDTWTLNDVDLAWHGEIAESEPALYAIIDAAGLARGKGMKSYLIMMAVRLLEMRRILKDTGSLYLHCDTTAGHYLKMLLDSAFGQGSFRSEITWRRTNAKGLAFKGYPNNADIILYYSKSESFAWNRPFLPHKEEYVNKSYRYVEPETGRRYRLGDLTNPNKNRPNLTYAWNGHTRVWRWTKERMQKAHDQGLIHYSSTGLASQKRFLDEMQGTPVDTIWEDIKRLEDRSPENTHYPTQKPLALLERIIQASSNEGDVVLDPFCGCATACVAAEKLGRQWAGIDISPNALVQVNNRLRKELGLFSLNVTHRTDIPQRTDLGLIPPYRTQKHTLFGKFEGICQGCRISFPFRNFTIDHIIPTSRGGTGHLENLQLLCGACNSVKGSGTNEEFLVKLSGMGLR